MRQPFAGVDPGEEQQPEEDLQVLRILKELTSAAVASSRQQRPRNRSSI